MGYVLFRNVQATSLLTGEALTQRVCCALAAQIPPVPTGMSGQTARKVLELAGTALLGAGCVLAYPIIKNWNPKPVRVLITGAAGKQWSGIGVRLDLVEFVVFRSD